MIVDKIMGKIFLIRHTEILDSQTRRFFGHTDVPLSQWGIRQAHLLVNMLSHKDFSFNQNAGVTDKVVIPSGKIFLADYRLRQEKIGKIYASDLYRSQYPACLLADNLNLSVVTRKELREINFGDWEGLTFKDIEDSFPELCHEWLTHPREFCFPNGESMDEFSERVTKEYRSILYNSDSIQHGLPPANIAIITHGGVIRIILAKILGLNMADMWTLQIDYGSVNCISYHQTSPPILTINDLSYLEDQGDKIIRPPC